MSNPNDIPLSVTHEVRDTCLCLSVQRAARMLARRFDEALREIGITSGQFSLLMSLNRPEAPTMGNVASVLAMDRTTLTAALKPLQRQGLVDVWKDENDRRARRMSLTVAGKAVLAAALPIWRSTHAAIEEGLAAPDLLRSDLRALA